MIGSFKPKLSGIRQFFAGLYGFFVGTGGVILKGKTNNTNISYPFIIRDSADVDKFRVVDTGGLFSEGVGNFGITSISASTPTCTIGGGHGVVVGSNLNLAFAASANAGAGRETYLSRLAAGVMGITSWLQDSGSVRRTATQAVTNSTSFAADDTLTKTLIAGRKYRYEIWYAFATTNTSGVKVDLAGGTATVTAINGQITISSSASAVLGGAQVTALASTAGVTATGTLAMVYINGTLEVNAGGTFVPRFAQNAETGAAEAATAQIGSYMTLTDIA